VQARNLIAEFGFLQTAIGLAFTDEDVVLNVWIAGI
jgi:hypothetical protein